MLKRKQVDLLAFLYYNSNEKKNVMYLDNNELIKKSKLILGDLIDFDIQQVDVPITDIDIEKTKN